MNVDIMSSVDMLRHQTFGNVRNHQQVGLFEDADVEQTVVERSVRGDRGVEAELVAVGK